MPFRPLSAAEDAHSLAIKSVSQTKFETGKRLLTLHGGFRDLDVLKALVITVREMC